LTPVMNQKHMKKFQNMHIDKRKWMMGLLL